MERFKRLRKAHSVYNAADTRLRNSSQAKPVSAVPRGPELTPAQAEQLRPAYRTYVKELYKRYTKAELEQIAQGNGDPDVVALYNRVIEPAITFRRYQQRMLYRREKAPLDSGFYTPEQLKRIEDLEQVKTTNREGYLEWARRYTKSAAKDELRKRMMARPPQGTEAELDLWNKLYPQHRAYMNAYREINTMGRLIVIEFDNRLRDKVLRMEQLRQPALDYFDRFGGKERKEWREELKKGNGDPKDVADYRRLRPHHLEYRRLYARARRESKKLSMMEKELLGKKTASEEEPDDDDDVVDDDDDDGTVDEEASDAKIREEIKGVGVRRYFVSTRPRAGKSKSGATTSSTNAFQLRQSSERTLGKVTGLVNSAVEDCKTFFPNQLGRSVQQLPKTLGDGLQRGLQRAFPNRVGLVPPNTILGGYGGGPRGLPGRAAPVR